MFNAKVRYCEGGGLGVRLATGSAVVEEHHTPWHTTAVARPVYRHAHG